MRKMLGLVVVLVAGMAMTGAAGLAEDSTAASQAYNDRDYAAAKALYAKVVEQETNPNNLMLANYHIADCLSKGEKKHAEAEAVCRKALADYPLALMRVRVLLQYAVGDFMAKQGLKAGANAEYMKAVLDYAFEVGVPDAKCVIWGAYEKINPALMTVDDYKAFLTNVIKATRGTEANAMFLGRVKSDLSKLQ